MSKGSLLLTRNRIEAVGTIFGLSKSMEAIASSKFRVAKKRNYFFSLMKETATEFMSKISIPSKGREVIIVVSSDSSLCGSYLSNMNRKSLEHDNLTVVGETLKRFLTLKGRSFHELDVTSLSAGLLSGEVGKIRMIYSKFKNAKVEIVDEVIYPVSPEKFDGDVEISLQKALPLCLKLCINANIVAAEVAEHYSRMMAMGNARRNSEDLILDLRKNYNKQRQYLITKEIIEIVGGENEE